MAEYSPTATEGQTGYWGNTYGSSNTSNTFQIWNWRQGRYKGNLGGAKYYPIVNKDTGDIAVVKFNPAGNDYSIGTIKQSDGDFINYAASQEENYYFNLPKNAEKLKRQAVQTANIEYNALSQGNRPNKTPHQLLFTNTNNAQIIPPYDDNASVRGGLAGVAESVPAILSGLGGASGLGGRRRNNDPSIISFPGGITDNGQDYIEIVALRYEPSQVAAGGNVGWARTRGGGAGADSKVIDPRIILPIPGGITDSNGVTWGEGKMTAADMAKAQIVLSGLEGDLEAGLTDQLNKVQAQSGPIKEALKTGIAGALSGTDAQLLQRTAGKVMNPNMELLFGGPTLRTFTFNFKLSARNPSESNTIVKIISHFKKNMAPSAAGGNLFLKSPNTWRLTYKHKGGDHRFLNKFKECALTNCSVQYTDGGNYSTYEDGAMTTYGLGLTFQEMEPIFQNDYEGSNEIGY